jgi:hypothetical protein
MVAMIWFSLWGGYLTTALYYIGPPPLSEGLRILLFVVGNSLTFGLPVVAVSSLFGRTERGLIIWAAIAVVLLILVMILRLFMDFP